MIRCSRCQHENAVDAGFCDECGARLDMACPGCGAPNRAGAKFCRKCGQGLAEATGPIQAPQSKFATPETYTPRHLAEKILTSKAALEGERKQVTVLFADLKGSMELLADRDPEEARKILDPILERMMEAVQLSPDISDQLGYAYALSGRTAEGLAVLEEARAAMEAMGMVQWRTPLLVHLGEAYLLAGRRDDAVMHVECGLTLARERGHRGSEAWALRLLGEIAAHDDRPSMATAEAHYRAALNLATELGMRPLLAHCHLGLGNLCRGTGKQAKAEEHLATATAMYREMDMRFYLEQAEAEMRDLGERPS